MVAPDNPFKYRPGDWVTQAACATYLVSHGTDYWFYTSRRKGDPYADAKRICKTCPVLNQCKQWGDETETNFEVGQLYGVIGGETVIERLNRRPTRPNHLTGTCRRGHPWTEETLRYRRSGDLVYRSCRKCAHNYTTKREGDDQ